MPWPFVGRTEQIERARRALRSRPSGPIVIAGEPGMGRTSVLSHILGHADPERDRIVLMRPAGDSQLAAVRAAFRDCVPAAATLPEAVRAITAHAAGSRLVIAADDAHLMDHLSLLALREISRVGSALLLVTRVSAACPPGRPDPTECLSYERDVHKLILCPLGVDEVAAVLASAVGHAVEQATAEAVHAATGGNPRLLHELVAGTGLAECLVRQGDRWRLDAPSGPAAAGRSYPAGARVAEAAWDAWQELATERADQLCRLALWCGIRDEIASIWACLLLFRGHADACMDFLDSLGAEPVAATPSLALIKALALALCLDRAEEADRFLLNAAVRDGSPRLSLAHRAWVLALTGHLAEAAEALSDISRGDPETALFVHAARGALTRLVGHPGEAVFHLRRALVTAEGRGMACPWMRPYLKASLIDALMMSGRAKEAASLARRFHAHEPGSGWEFAVALQDLIAIEVPRPRGSGVVSSAAPTSAAIAPLPVIAHPRAGSSRERHMRIPAITLPLG